MCTILGDYVFDEWSPNSKVFVRKFFKTENNVDYECGASVRYWNNIVSFEDLFSPFLMALRDLSGGCLLSNRTDRLDSLKPIFHGVYQVRTFNFRMSFCFSVLLFLLICHNLRRWSRKLASSKHAHFIRMKTSAFC